MLYQKLVRPFVFWYSKDDPERAHEKVLALLSWTGKHERLAGLIEQLLTIKNERLEQEAFGLKFRNPVGLAAGFDKNAVASRGLQSIGLGFIEDGTITQYEQAGYPRPRIHRIPRDKAVINRMGFNNDGADKIEVRLAQTERLSIPVGINLGKSMITPLEKAVEDYLYSFRMLYRYGDYFVINVSSPNTPGLRKLQEKDSFNTLLLTLQTEAKNLAVKFGIEQKPVLAKIAPDLSWEAIDELLEVCLERKVAGLIVCNTTITRDGLSVPTNWEGGLSGEPLWFKAISLVRYISQHTEKKLPIIGVGGISNPEKAYEMLKYACLIQVLTGLVYEGPFIASTINRGLLRLMNRDGIKYIRELRR